MMGRLLITLQALWASATATPQATRVGLLNTGELVLVDSLGHAQILSAQTTDVVRVTVLARPLGGDPVHLAVHSLRRAP